MNKQERREAWAQALEGGEYTQTKGALRDRAGYCALGVGCDVYARATGVLVWSSIGSAWWIGNRVATMPDAVARWYSAPAFRLEAISSANDRGVPLAELAPLVRGK